MKFPTTFAKGGRSLWTAKIISQSRQNARRDSIFSVKNEVLSSISSTRVTQTEPSPGRSAARRPPWQTNCGAAHRLVRAIRAGNPATRQGAARPSTRPTESILADTIGFAAATASFVGWQSSSKSTSGLWTPASVMPACTGCSRRTRWYARTPCITRYGPAISTCLWRSCRRP